MDAPHQPHLQLHNQIEELFGQRLTIQQPPALIGEGKSKKRQLKHKGFLVEQHIADHEEDE